MAEAVAVAVAVEFVPLSTSWRDAAWRLFEVPTVLLFPLLTLWRGAEWGSCPSSVLQLPETSKMSLKEAVLSNRLSVIKGSPMVLPISIRRVAKMFLLT